MESPENEGLNGEEILQAEVAGTRRRQHAGHPVEMLTPPAGDALEGRGIAETIRIRGEASLLLTGKEVLWTGDVLDVMPEAAKNGRAQCRSLSGLINLHRRLQQQRFVGVHPHRWQLHGHLRRPTPHILYLLKEGVVIFRQVDAGEIGGEMGFVFHANPINAISDTQQIQPFIEREAIGAIEIRNNHHPAALQFRQHTRQGLTAWIAMELRVLDSRRDLRKGHRSPCTIG